MKKLCTLLFVAANLFLSIISPLSFNPSEKVFGLMSVPYATVIEYVNYSDSETDTYFTGFGLPRYSNDTNNMSCGPVSGAIICGYYDMFYPNVVPSFVTSYTLPEGSGFYSTDPKITRLINNLTTFMCASNGCTVAQYKSGLSDYFRLFAGLTVSYNSVMQGSSLNFAACKAEIDAGRPVAIFMSYYNTSWQATPQAGQDRIRRNLYNNNHVFTAYGYQTTKYYRIENGAKVLFRTDRYLLIQTGWGNMDYMSIDGNLSLNDACGVGVS